MSEVMVLTFLFLSITACGIIALWWRLGVILREVMTGFLKQERLVDMAWKRVDQELRRAHTETMKALKGDSYSGQFGGMDVYTDHYLSSGQQLVMPASPGPYEKAFAHIRRMMAEAQKVNPSGKVDAKTEGDTQPMINGYRGVQIKDDGELYLVVGDGQLVEEIKLSWPEANRLQAEVRTLCVHAGLTIAEMPQ